jgi:hypothetical protein
MTDAVSSYQEHRDVGADAGVGDARGFSLIRVARTPLVWLGIVVSISFVVRLAIGLGMRSPWILPDEVLYSDLAKSIAGGGRPAVRDVPSLGWGVVYPTVISPAWLFGDTVTAYHAALAINGLLMSLAAVPSYFLARLFTSTRASLLVAATTVVVPSMAYTGVVMTENAFYPAFLLSVLLIARVVRRPTTANQGLALVGLVLVVLTRVQGVALVGAYVAAVIIFAATGSAAGRGDYLRRFLPSAVFCASGWIVALLASVAAGQGGLGWLGGRSGTFHAFQAHEVPEWLAYLVADLLLYVAIVPAAATAVVIGLGLSRRAPESDRLFAAVALPVFAAMLFSVSLVSASIDVDGTENLNERYVFYIAPLLFIGLALWIRQGLPRPRRSTAIVLAACFLLPVLLPVGRLAYNAEFQSIALLPWLTLSLPRFALASIIALFTLAGIGLWASCQPARSGRLWLAVLLWMTFLSLVAIGRGMDRSTFFADAYGGSSPMWVEEAVPQGATVAVLWDQRSVRRQADPLYASIMVTEFFNGSAGSVYRLGPPTGYEGVLPTVPSRIRDGNLVVDTHGRAVSADYVVVLCKTPVSGDVVARSDRGTLELVELNGPLRLSDRRPCSHSRP